MPVHDCIESHIMGPGVVNRDSTLVLDQMLDIFRIINPARLRRGKLCMSAGKECRESQREKCLAHVQFAQRCLAERCCLDIAEGLWEVHSPRADSQIHRSARLNSRRVSASFDSSYQS